MLLLIALYRDAIQLGNDILITYTSKLSHWLSYVFAYNPIVLKSSVFGDVSKIEGTRMFLQEIYQKFVEKTNKYKGENKEYYMHCVEDELYHLLILGASSPVANYRRNLKAFLLDPASSGRYTIILEGLDANIPDIFKSIDLDQRDIQHWKEKGVYESYITSFRIESAKEKDAPDLKPFNLLNNLKEPISQFGISLKNLALRYAQNNKKLYIIPMQTFSHGLAQKTQSNNKYDKKSVATDFFKDSLLWRAWELNWENLDEFQSKYA